MSEYRPGDVVNGWELGQDLQWHPARVAPQGLGSQGTRALPAQRWDALAPAGGAGSWDGSWDGVVQGGAGYGTGVVGDPFDDAGPAPERGRRKGLVLGLGGAAVALFVGVAIGGAGDSPASASPGAGPAPTVTVTTDAEPAPAVTVTKTAKVTVTETVPAKAQGFADTGSSNTGASDTGSSDSTDTDSSASAYYKNCTAARAAGAAPLHRGDPGYRSGLDRDNDGVACE